MTDEATTGTPEEAAGDGDHFEELRRAAGEVVASLKHLLEAAERVIGDPEAFAEVAAGGKSVVEAFVGGFTSQAAPAAGGAVDDLVDEAVGDEGGPAGEDSG